MPLSTDVKNVLIIGATGDVGRGIAAGLAAKGHALALVARDPSRLDALRARLAAESTGGPGAAPLLHAIVGSVANDADAAVLRDAALQALGAIDCVVISVNAPRRPAPLLGQASAAFAQLIEADLVTHYCAARAFIDALRPGGLLLGIGGGSCDFVLHEGVAQSVAQAGLRMLYRGLAHECRDRDLHVRELIIASVVNGASTRSFADPLWVTAEEIGAQVASILAAPQDYPDPILRIARRDASGRPVFTTEGASRIQGFRS